MQKRRQQIQSSANSTNVLLGKEVLGERRSVLPGTGLLKVWYEK